MKYTTAATLGIKVGNRLKRGARYVDVLEISPCGQYVRIFNLSSKRREWCAAQELTPEKK